MSTGVRNALAVHVLGAAGSLYYCFGLSDKIGPLFWIALVYLSSFTWAICLGDPYFEERYGREIATKKTLTLIVIGCVIGLCLLVTYFVVTLD